MDHAADPNGRRLASVMKMFALAPSAVARAASVSPAYLRRVLSDSDPFVGSAEFYRRLEACLGALVEHRQTQFFRATPMNVRAVEKAARGVLDPADAGRCLHHGGRPAERQPGQADIIALGTNHEPSPIAPGGGSCRQSLAANRTAVCRRGTSGRPLDELDHRYRGGG